MLQKHIWNVLGNCNTFNKTKNHLKSNINRILLAWGVADKAWPANVLGNVSIAQKCPTVQRIHYNFICNEF